MQDSSVRNIVLECTSETLQEVCPFSATVARGTLRLALKEAGLSPKHVTVNEMGEVIQKLLPEMLRLRGVREPLNVCQALLKELESHRKPRGLLH